MEGDGGGQVEGVVGPQPVGLHQVGSHADQRLADLDHEETRPVRFEAPDGLAVFGGGQTAFMPAPDEGRSCFEQRES